MSKKTTRSAVWAEAHSDDYVVEIDFDAVPWFRQASDKEILALAECGWRGDYPADNVAKFFDQMETKWLFEYLDKDPTMPNGDTVGFECSVDSSDAAAYLKANRPELHAKIENKDLF